MVIVAADIFCHSYTSVLINLAYHNPNQMLEEKK